MCLVVLDKKSESIAHLTIATSYEEVCRLICESLQDPNSMLAKYPDDFQVLCLGKINICTGEIVADLEDMDFVSILYEKTVRNLNQELLHETPLETEGS